MLDYIKFLVKKNTKNKFLWLLFSIIVIIYFALVFLNTNSFTIRGIASFNFMFDFYVSITLMGYIIYPVKMIGEYKEGFLIDSILSGYKRSEIYIANFLIYFLICTLFTLALPIIVIGYTSIVNGFGLEISVAVLRNLGVFFIKILLASLTFSSIYYFLAFTINNLPVYMLLAITFHMSLQSLIHLQEGLLYEIVKYTLILDLPDVFSYQTDYRKLLDMSLHSLLTTSFFLVIGYLIFRKRKIK